MISISNKSQQGLTLTELMVAMVISLVVLAGVLQIFTSNKQAYRSIEALSRLQENSRFAMFFLSRDIRNSDYWGCTPVRESVIGTAYADGILGDNDQSVTGLVNSDAITLTGSSSNGTSVNSTSGNVVAVDSTADFAVGDSVVVGNCESAQIVKVTAKTASTLTMDANLIREYSTDATVHTVVARRYFLGAGSNGPSLFVEFDLNGDGDFNDTGEAGQELIEGIEDLQILYGEDTNNSLTPNRYVAAGTTGLNMRNVVSVKVALTARTLDDNIAITSRTYNGVADKRLTKNFSATIAVRNRLL